MSERHKQAGRESPPVLGGEADDVTQPVEDLERELKKVRPVLAARILALLALVIVLYAALAATTTWTGFTADQLNPWFSTVFTGLMTLAGSATGFYFGNRSSARGRNQ